MSTQTLAGGRYTLERPLGRGGMATVHLGRDEELRRPVAIKVLASQLAGDPEFRERFVREARRLAARLSHPNVVQVFDAGEDGDRPYIVMEYVPGSTLAGRGRLPPGEAIEVALQACAGLQHAHDANLVHRDVKPGNLLLRDDGVVKIADFGIARAAEATRVTQIGTVLGTAAYLSPEQAAGEEVTPSADVYALGAVLYELLTGRAPYQFESLADLAAKQSSGAITPPRDIDPAIPDGLEAVVMRCLARDPRFRPASAAELALELSAVSLHAPTVQVTPATAQTAPLPPRTTQSVPGSGTWLWIAGASIAAAVAIVLGIFDIGGGGAPDRSQPPRVRSIPLGAAPADEARNLSAWLRSYSK